MHGSDDLWYGKVRLLTRIRIQTDDDIHLDQQYPDEAPHAHDVDCAMIECFERFRDPALDEHHIVLVQPTPQPVVYVTPLEGIKGRISVVPYGETGTIPYSKRHLRNTAFGDWARADGPGEAGKGKGSPLYHLNTWAMEWPRDLDLPAGEPDSEDDDPVDRGGAGEQEDSASEGGAGGEPESKYLFYPEKVHNYPGQCPFLSCLFLVMILSCTG